MATFTSIADGMYSVGTTWDQEGATPGAGDAVIIDGGYTVNLVAGAGAAASLLIKNGALRIFDQTSTVGGDCRIGTNGAITAGSTADTLVVGGDCIVESGAGPCAMDILTVTGRMEITGREIGPLTLTVSGQAVILGGTIIQLDASGGNQVVAYGSMNLGGNTNIIFQAARWRRVPLNTYRRGWVSGVVA